MLAIVWKFAIGCFLLFALLYFSAFLGNPLGERSNGPGQVKNISVNDLKDLLEGQQQAARKAKAEGVEPPEPQFVLVDVRSDAEVKVSIIPGAITKSQYEADRTRYRGRLAIFYCTVGVRSEDYAERTTRQGIHAQNFRGSILEWVDAGLPLETTEGDPTNRVHTYSDQYRDRVPADYEAVTT